MSVNCDKTCFVIEYFPVSFNITHSQNVEIEQMALKVSFEDSKGSNQNNLVKVYDSNAEKQ